MTIEGEGAGNVLAAHAIEARDIDQAQLPAAGNSPLGKGALEPVFTDDNNGSHGQHLVVEVLQRRGPQPALDQRAGLKSHVVGGPQSTVARRVRFPSVDSGQMIDVVLVQQGKKAGCVTEDLKIGLPLIGQIVVVAFGQILEPAAMAPHDGKGGGPPCRLLLPGQLLLDSLASQFGNAAL